MCYNISEDVYRRWLVHNYLISWNNKFYCDDFFILLCVYVYNNSSSLFFKFIFTLHISITVLIIIFYSDCILTIY